MFSKTPRLRTLRPSPTTAEFTVTTAPPTTLTLRILRLILLALRITLSFAVAFILHSRWVHCPLATPLANYSSPPRTYLSEASIWYLVAQLHSTTAGAALARLVSDVPNLILVPASLLLAYVLSLRVHASESLLVLRGLGVQTSETASTYLASSATRFIPTEKIQDIFVNEAFRGSEVRYYLVVVVEGEEDVVVVFPRLLPRRAIVEAVWRGARECLYEGKKGIGDDKSV